MLEQESLIPLTIIQETACGNQKMVVTLGLLYNHIDLSLTRNNRFYVINDVLARDNNGQTEVYMAVGSKYDHNFIGLQGYGWYKSQIDGGVTWEDFFFFLSK